MPDALDLNILRPEPSAVREMFSTKRSVAVGLKGDARAIDPLIAALKDTTAQVRSQSAWALGLKGDGRSVEPLKVALNDTDEHVRKQAAWALQLRGLK
jgi:HEAT repeat protein